MKNLFVPYELAVIAKEKGFNERGLAYYNEDKELITGGDWSHHNALCHFSEHWNWGLEAPLYQQLVDWFREKHKIDIAVSPELFIIKNRLFEVDVETCWEAKIYSHTKLINRITKKEYYSALTKAIEEAFKLL